MNVESERSGASLVERLHLDWGAVWTWTFCLALVLYLSLEGGGYDPLVGDRVGIAVWWLVLLGGLVGAMPRGRVNRGAIAAIALLALFVIWTGLSLTWTESTQKTWADLARLSAYLGIFVLAIGSAGSSRGRHLVAATATAVAVVSVIALLSRIHPSWFESVNQTARQLGNSERLSYPINYWNGLAALVAMGLPLVLHQAAEASRIAFRAIAAAAMPAMVLTIFFTISRSGIAAAAIAVGVYLVFAGDRLPKVLSLLVGGAGGAVLVAKALGNDSLRHGLENGVASDQASSTLVATIVVCLAVGLVQLALMAAFEGARRPAWTRPNRQQTTTVALVGLVVAIIAVIGLGGIGKAESGWREFREGGEPGRGASRLGSFAGESRYELWKAAADENSSRVLTGTGSGTFEFWWARNGTNTSVVKDTHSLWLQTLGEVGFVGLVLLVGFLGVVVVSGAERLLRLGVGKRSPPAAALGGVIAFCITASVDWMWQLPALVAVLLLLAAALVGPSGSVREGPRPLRVVWRLPVAIAAAAAIVFIALPFASTSQVRASEADARDGDLTAALAAARSAQNVLPGTAGPRLQEALVLEEMGRFGEAAAAARAATEREDTNWRNFLVLSRVEAENGEAAAAVADYRKAKSLYPRLALFDPS